MDKDKDREKQRVVNVRERSPTGTIKREDFVDKAFVDKDDLPTDFLSRYREIHCKHNSSILNSNSFYLAKFELSTDKNSRTILLWINQ